MANNGVTPDTIGASAGIGTLVILLADRIDPSSLWRELLVIGAPSITLISGWIWSVAKNQVFLVVDDYNSKKTFARARQIVEGARSRGADDDQLEELSKELNELERQKMASLKSRANLTFE